MQFAFIRGTEEVRGDKNSWLLMEKGYMKKETVRLILANDSVKCRMCGEIDENVSHLV